MTENTCRKISVKQKYMTHSEGNLAQEESHDEITLGHSYVYDRKCVQWKRLY